MEIKDVTFGKGTHQSDEGVCPNIHVSLNDDERWALFAVLLAHHRVNPDDTTWRQLPEQTRRDIRYGEKHLKGVVLRMNEIEEYEVLMAAAWTVHNAEEIVPFEDSANQGGVASFREALTTLRGMITELEVAGVLPLEQPTS